LHKMITLHTMVMLQTNRNEICVTPKI